MRPKYLRSALSVSTEWLKKRFILLSLGIFYSFIAQAEPKVSNMIKPVEYFIDPTNQLEKIEENLRIFGKTGIKGTSGMGKMQVARAYADRNVDKYNLIWFLESNRNIEGIGEVRVESISKSWKEQKAIKEIMIFLTS